VKAVGRLVHFIEKTSGWTMQKLIATCKLWQPMQHYNATLQSQASNTHAFSSQTWHSSVWL